VYKKVFESKTIHMTNKHYKELLRRFDKRNFVEKLSLHQPPTMVNNVPCALCKSFFKRDSEGEDSCGECPIATFGSRYYFGCTHIMSKLSITNSICTSIGNVTYKCADKRDAISNLETMTNFMKSFTKEKPGTLDT